VEGYRAVFQYYLFKEIKMLDRKYVLKDYFIFFIDRIECCPCLVCFLPV